MEALRNAAPSLFYGGVSLSAVLFNKAVLSSYAFKFPVLLTLGQVVFSLLFLVVAKQARLVTYPDVSLATARAAVPLAVVFVLNVVIGLSALRLVNVPMFSALRRLTIVFVMLGEYLMLGKAPALPVVGSVAVMLSGAALAGANDLAYDPLGYLLVLINNLATAFQLVYIKKLDVAKDLSIFGSMLYNNLLSLPVTIALAFWMGEAEAVFEYPHLYDWDFQLIFFISCAQVFLLNYSIFLCSTRTSPLSTTVTGQMKNILTTVLGFVLFPSQSPPHVLMLGGLSLGIVGSITYAVVKYREKPAAAAGDKKKD